MGNRKTAFNTAAAITVTWAVVTLAWICFIFGNSLQSGKVSSSGSGAVLKIVNDVLTHTGTSLRVTSFIIRKSAHFIEFAVLGVLLYSTIRRVCRRGWRRVVFPMSCALLTAVCDETIQLFVPGRGSAAADAALDFAGAVTGIALTLILCKLTIDNGQLRN